MTGYYCQNHTDAVLERGIAQAAKGALNAVLDILYPIRCLGCFRVGRFICNECVARLPTLEDPMCRICASPGVNGTCRWCRDKKPAIDRIDAPYLYVHTSPIHSAITMLKYQGVRAIAPEMAELLAAHYRRKRTIYDVIVPVVSHPARVRKRGYSQATLIASHLGPLLDTPVGEHLLRRVRDAPSQLQTASRDDRWTNVQGGFASDSDLSGMTVLLVDDLVTTGSTASACASALKRAGAQKVVALSVARAP